MRYMKLTNIFLCLFFFIIFVMLVVEPLRSVKETKEVFTIRWIENNIRSLEPEIKERAMNWIFENDIPTDVLSEEDPIVTFKKCLEKGSLEIVKSLNDKFNIDVEKENISSYLDDETYSPKIKILRWACMYGHLNIIEWLIDILDITEEEIRHDSGFCFRSAVGSGNIPLASYLKNKFNLNEGDARAANNNALVWASLYGNFDSMKWLIFEFNLTREDVFSNDFEVFINCCYGGFIDILKWLDSEYIITKEEASINNNEALKNIVRHNKEMFVWFINKYSVSDKILKDNLRFLLERGSLENVKYILDKLSLKSSDILKIEILETLVSANKKENLEYIHSRYTIPISLVKSNDNCLYKIGRSNDSTETCDWLIKTFNVL